MESNMNSI